MIHTSQEAPPDAHGRARPKYAASRAVPLWGGTLCGCLAVLGAGAASSAQTGVYINRSAFLSAIASIPRVDIGFEASTPGPLVGDEFLGLGVRFRSPLAPPLGQLSIVGPRWYWPNNCLNIDEEPGQGGDGNEDSLTVEFTPASGYSAFGVDIVDGFIPDPAHGEHIRVYDRGGQLLLDDAGPASAFFGYVSNMPIGRVEIVEAAWDNDDIGYDNFILAGACYANCDASTVVPILNINDFICFLNKFAAADPYANCDGSTTAPVLNVLDFTCFLNAFAAGCP